MKKERKQCEEIPRGYRVAYCDYWRDVDICYPIGIHWIARMIRRIWEWSLNSKPSKHELYMFKFEAEILERGRESRRQELARQEARHRREIDELKEKHKVQLLATALKARQDVLEGFTEEMGS